MVYMICIDDLVARRADTFPGGFGGGLNEKVCEAYTLCVFSRPRDVKKQPN